MAGKARVHELAKELGVDSKTVLTKLQDLGEYVKSASSTVEAPVARRLRESMVAAPAAAAPAAPRRQHRSRRRRTQDFGEAGTADEGDPEEGSAFVPGTATGEAGERTRHRGRRSRGSRDRAQG